MRKALIVPIALVGILLSSCGSTFTAAAAVVNGTRISLELVEDEIDSALESPQGQSLVGQEPNARTLVARRVLEGFIIRIVRRQAATKLGISLTERDINDEIERLRTNFGQQGIDATIAEQGWTPREFREQVHDFALNNRLFEELAPVTDARLRSEYNANREDFRQVRFSDILIKTEPTRPAARALRLINAVKSRIQSGESFADVAKEVSEDETTKAEGGARGGFILANSLDVTDAGVGGGPGLGAHALRAPLNRLAGPVRTAAGYHLLLVIGKGVLPFADAKEEIRSRLQQSLGLEAVNTFDAESLKDADIVVNPRYGEWSEDHIAAQEFFEPPTTDGNEPPSGAVVTPAPVAPAPGGG